MKSGLNTDSSGTYPPGFYRTNARVVSIKELIRWYGIWRLPLVYLVTRLGPRQKTGSWMPQLWKDLECEQQDLSDHFWQMTHRHRDAMEKLDFVCTGFSKFKPTLNLTPNVLETGRISYLHKNNSYIGIILYRRSHVPGPVYKTRDMIIIAFTAVYKDQSLSVTNNKLVFEPDADQKVIRILKDDASLLYDEFLKAVQREQEQPVVFSDHDQMRQWFDSRQIKSFETRVKRGLFIKMTDLEIEQARRRVPPPLPKAES